MEKSHMERFKSIKRISKLLGNLLFIFFMIIMGILIFITGQSRFTGREPSLFNHRLYIVDSGSMNPTISIDSMIVVKESMPEDIKKGDIITYYGSRSSVKVTHRVMEVGGQGEFFITKGDANKTNDFLPVEGEKVIGKVVFTIPLIGIIFRFLGSIQGIISLAVIGVIWIVVPKVFVGRGGGRIHKRQPMDS